MAAPTEEGTVELNRDEKMRIDGIAGSFGSRWAGPDEVGWSFEESAFFEFCAALLSRSPVVGAPNLPHLYEGDCPDEHQPDARDPHCPACQALSVVGAVGGEALPFERIESLAHRTCTEYAHVERVKYRFARVDLETFARAIEATHGIGVSPTGSPEGEATHE